jgi:tetratricopeptide (TPR) repeat protein
MREFGKRLGVTADYLATGEDPGPSAADVALADAQLAHRLGDADGALTAFARLAASDVPSIQRGAKLGLAQIALERGSIKEAIDLLEQLDLVSDPDAALDPAPIEALAQAYAVRGDLAAALALLETKLNGLDDPIARFRLTVILANVLIDLGQFDRAETLIGDELAKLGPAADTIALARCLWSQSRLQTARGNNDLAASYAEQALALIRTTEHTQYAARAHQVLAYIEVERGEPHRALALLDEALPLVIGSGDQLAINSFQLERARALVAVGELDDARELASDLIRNAEGFTKGDYARALSTLADILAKTGEQDRALGIYEAAAAELAGHEHEAMLVDLYTRWSDLLADTGDTERALEIARLALSTRTPDRRTH